MQRPVHLTAPTKVKAAIFNDSTLKVKVARGSQVKSVKNDIRIE